MRQIIQTQPTGVPNPVSTPWVGTINVLPIGTSESCGGTNTGAPQEDLLTRNTIVNLNGTLLDVKVQHKASLYTLEQLDLPNTLRLFEPISELPDVLVDTASETVRHFVSVARAMTRTTGLQLRSATKSAWLPESIVGTVKSANALIISPNPTNEQFDIALPQGNYDIQVFDAPGKLIFSKYTEGVTKVDVHTWQNGLYMVALLNKATKQKTFGKVVVQH